MKFTPLPMDHDVPVPSKSVLVVHVCQRESLPTMLIRKFKSGCGNTLEVHLTRKSGFIRSITALDTCQPNCPLCRDRAQFIRQLIAQEYKLA